MKKKGLEEAIKEKVSSLLEKTMEKSWGITIPKIESDITDKLNNQQLNVYISTDLPFQEAKQKFKSEFLKNELRLHKGNISQMAKFLGLDRRSIHRVIKNLEIDLEDVRHHESSEKEYKEDIIRQTIQSALENYKEVIQPEKMEKIYEEVPSLSRNIARLLPHQHLTWKEAEKEFEKQFLAEVLKESNWNVAKAADKIEIRVETLHRKIKKLELKKEEQQS
ncbi:MAG: hypothetical protein KKA62_02530 [Nanoarchaeota archaeon]|nr:hypothetical protein [Nanoarchaeota archaeon]MBU1644362.1 hypothetical protein [Nanoarchaeota archaeon]MBU1976807.1 hypothetical protein [Nanoarchaeota archaeon]